MVHIDSLMQECGLFNGDTDLNNGYGCKSKSNGKQAPGACFAFDCPLAYEANLEDMKEHDKDLYEEYKQEEFDLTEIGSGWMVQYREAV